MNDLFDNIFSASDSVRSAPVANYSWDRFPITMGGQPMHRAHYSLLKDDEPTGIWVRWCGHATAHRPYYLRLPDGDMHGTYRTVADAKAAAIAWYMQAHGFASEG